MTCHWRTVRKVKDGPQDFELYGFFTTSPNGVVKPIHEKVLPVILTRQDEIETSLTVPMDRALKLQRPLPHDMIRIVPAPSTQVAEAAAAKPAPTQPKQLPLF